MPPANTPARRVAPSSSVSTSATTTTTNILLFLIAFRILNAFTLRTFFQPDEFFQSLEPAWQIAFGKEQGAWITWVRGPRVVFFGIPTTVTLYDEGPEH
jgi:phosphatidylinositol glycan class B